MNVDCYVCYYLEYVNSIFQCMLQELQKLLSSRMMARRVAFATDGDDGSGHKLKTKRVRTSFTEEQLRILHANFRVDSNPDGQDLERIAQQTGLSKRVTQVGLSLLQLSCLLKHIQSTREAILNLHLK